MDAKEEKDQNVYNKTYEIPEIYRNLHIFINEDSIYGQRSYENFVKT